MIRITNSGEWVSPRPGGSGHSTGMGIKNIRARLTHFYKDAFELTREDGNGSVSMSLYLPDGL